LIIEAGTPFIKREGIAGIRMIRRMWRGFLVADLKITDGAADEVSFAAGAGANAVTVMGSTTTKTIDLTIEACARHRIYSIVDMLGVIDPLKRMMPLKHPPDVVVIHKGRDEENVARAIIRYKDIMKIKSKFSTFIAVAGGLELQGIRTAYFNGANIAIVNIISRYDDNKGIIDTSNFRVVIPAILREVGA
jgi:bifunctional enzyme Fae/Hps